MAGVDEGDIMCTSEKNTDLSLSPLPHVRLKKRLSLNLKQCCERDL